MLMFFQNNLTTHKDLVSKKEVTTAVYFLISCMWGQEIPDTGKWESWLNPNPSLSDLSILQY